MSTVVLVINVLYKEHVMVTKAGEYCRVSFRQWNARVKLVSDDLNLFASITTLAKI